MLYYCIYLFGICSSTHCNLRRF